MSSSNAHGLVDFTIMQCSYSGLRCHKKTVVVDVNNDVSSFSHENIFFNDRVKQYHQILSAVVKTNHMLI